MSLVGDIRRLLGVAPPKRRGHVTSSLAARTAFNSAGYWDHHYGRGRTSGPGSYGRLSEHKAKVVNGLVERHGLSSIIEFGCGDGNQCRMFEVERYFGVDVSPTAVDLARTAVQDRPEWNFMTTDEHDAAPVTAEMALSLDVIYHLIEDEVFEGYMHRLVSSGDRLVVIYASDHDSLGEAAHVRHRNYSGWIARQAPWLRLIETIENPYPFEAGADPKTTSFAYFRVFSRDGAAR